MMRTVVRLERLGDYIFHSVEANPKYNRDVIAVLGVEVSRPVALTTGSLVELENEKRAVHRTPVGTLLCMCQEHADIMYSVKETARKILCVPLRATI